MSRVGPFEENPSMFEDKKHKSSNLTMVGCLLAFVLVLASLFLTGIILSTSGIGVVGNANGSPKSPVGVWNAPDGAVIEFRADGTASSTKDGAVAYHEWRLKGDKLALYLYASDSPTSTTVVRGRVLRGIGLMDKRGDSRYEVVDVTPEKLTLAIDEDGIGHYPATWEPGDQIEYTAATEDEAAKASSAVKSE